MLFTSSVEANKGQKNCSPHNQEQKREPKSLHNARTNTTNKKKDLYILKIFLTPFSRKRSCWIKLKPFETLSTKSRFFSLMSRVRKGDHYSPCRSTYVHTRVSICLYSVTRFLFVHLIKNNLKTWWIIYLFVLF